MKNYFSLTLVFLIFFSTMNIFAMGRTPTWPEKYAENNSQKLRSGIPGWNVMSDDYRKKHILDGLSLEWDYFSIHDEDGKFSGVVAYLVADPMGHIGDPQYVWEPNLMPSGGNVACFGKVFSTGKKYADYVSFGLNFEAGKNSRSFFAYSDDQDYYGEMIPVKGDALNPDKLILKGRTKHFEWELDITQMWAGNKSLPGNSYPNYDKLKEKTWEIGNDVNLIKIRGEHWTVNMNWPTTKVTGWIKDRTTEEVISINGHGYRENSFGRWAFPVGGWDFYFLSDVTNKVQFGFQTYHHDTKDLDYVDVDFIDNGTPVSVRFKGKDGQIGWHHTKWKWSKDAKQCRPLDAFIECKNDIYTVNVFVDIGDDYASLLSTTTPITSLYQITTMFPIISGTVTRNDTGEVVSKFSGQGGGEFSLMKSVIPLTDDQCNSCMKGYSNTLGSSK